MDWMSEEDQDEEIREAIQEAPWLQVSPVDGEAMGSNEETSLSEQPTSFWASYAEVFRSCSDQDCFFASNASTTQWDVTWRLSCCWQNCRRRGAV